MVHASAWTRNVTESLIVMPGKMKKTVVSVLIVVAWNFTFLGF